MFIFMSFLELKVCSYLFVHVSLLYWSFVQLFLQVSAGVFWSLLCIRDILLFKHCSCVRDSAIIGSRRNPNSFFQFQISDQNHKKLKKNDEHYMNTMNIQIPASLSHQKPNHPFLPFGFN